MKIYIAGPMRGIPNDNHPAFNEAAAKLRCKGHTVFSPAEADLSNGVQIGEMSGRALSAQILWDLECISVADAVVLLPGWIDSTGVRLELEMARFVGCKVYSLEEMANIPPEDIEVIQ